VPPAGAIEKSHASSQAVAVRGLFKQVFHMGPVPSERAAMRPVPGVATSWVSQSASIAARGQPTSKMPE
jgi:hypothetical protein